MLREASTYTGLKARMIYPPKKYLESRVRIRLRCSRETDLDEGTDFNTADITAHFRNTTTPTLIISKCDKSHKNTLSIHPYLSWKL